MKAYRKYMYVGLPVLGVLFYLFYLHRAAIDLVYSDYIRLTLSYLPDVWDPEKFFVPDLLTRIPVNFLERAVNDLRPGPGRPGLWPVCPYPGGLQQKNEDRGRMVYGHDGLHVQPE